LLSRALGVLEDRVVQAKLEVRAGNDGAIELYRRHGFTYRRRLSGYYANNEDALVFVQSL
jgi:ribosomal protein S18 acetylase RimI-like enzyme